MKREYHFYVYIIASLNKTIYIGVTNNIKRRIHEHKEGLIEGFSKKYDCNFLVYNEHYEQIEDAINREKQLKKWNRSKKVALIERNNPDWEDLSE
ncbi:MAG: GIY-YIG nuclease family protein [Bacteroidales bacterium]|nr:GIY-YIG nuclease family protein [Bacteroidales bacterium]